MTQPDAEKSLAPGDKPGVRAVIQDRILAILIIVVATFFWIEAGKIRADEAQMFPRAVLVLVYVLAALLALRTLSARKAQRASAIFISFPAFALFIVTSLIYVASVSNAGFFSASVIYMPIVAYLLGLRRHVFNLAVTIIFLVAAYAIFVVLFSRPLPPELLWGL